MAHQRGASIVEGIKEPHSVSLKVLRLSRPSLSIQHPLPTPTPSPTTSYPAAAASLSYPSSTPDNYILSPLLTLPPAFGSAYVGETFSCTLCANNELPTSGTKRITNMRIEAEMKIPSSVAPITLSLSTHDEDAASDDGTEKEAEEGVDLAIGSSLQKIVTFDLKEEGSHVLAVTVTYTEMTQTSGKVRTFRKLYQFVCKSCVVVRTKTGILPASASSKGRQWALEAQLENTGEEAITLEMVMLETKDGIRSQGLNWEVVTEAEELEKPVLMPGDVQQVAFRAEEVVGEDGKWPVEEDGRVKFGVLKMSWRGPMGNRGVLSTGSLGAKVR